MDLKAFALLNLYLGIMDAKGFIRDFYNLYIVTADDNNLTTTPIDEFQEQLNCRRSSVIEARKQLIEWGLLEPAGHHGRQTVFRFLPLEKSVFWKYIENRTNPHVVKAELKKLSFFGSTPTHTPVDEYDYSATEQMQLSSQKADLGTESHNSNNKLIDSYRPIIITSLSDSVPKPPYLGTESDVEVEMNEVVREKALKIYETWNEAVKKHTSRSITPVPRALRFKANEIKPTTLEHAICTWVINQGDEWETTWEYVLGKFKVNKMLKYGYKDWKGATLKWLFQQSEMGKGTGLDRILEGKYDSSDEEIKAVTNADEALAVAKHYENNWKGKSLTFDTTKKA